MILKLRDGCFTIFKIPGKGFEILPNIYYILGIESRAEPQAKGPQSPATYLIQGILSVNLWMVK